MNRTIYARSKRYFKSALRHPVVCLDFDGVIHSNLNWRGAEIITGAPVDGAKEAIEKLRSKYIVVVFSGRCNHPDGREAIIAWLKKWDIEVDEVCGEKPLAIVYLDDRGIQFNGHWDKALEDIETFSHWQSREKAIARRFKRLKRVAR